MGTAKRERQKQGRQQRLQAAEEAARRRKRFNGVRNFAIIIVLIFIGLFVLSRVQGKDKSSTSTSSSTASSSGLAPGATITGDTPCPNADGTSPRTTQFAKPPPTCIDATKTYTAKLSTSKGDITISLDPKTAPATVNNFVVLARYHFYDGVTFHRVIQGFMDQTGDATGNPPGTGGPGYTIPDELPPDKSVYTEGAVAMANTGQPNSGGSQFFVVIGSGGQQLAASYTKFGTVTAGLDVAQAINALGGTDQQGTPTQVVTVNSVTITES